MAICSQLLLQMHTALLSASLVFILYAACMLLIGNIVVVFLVLAAIILAMFCLPLDLIVICDGTSFSLTCKNNLSDSITD